MSGVNQAVDGLFKMLWTLFDGLNPWWGIWFFSVLIGIVALVAVKYLSNQTRIVELKDKYKAHVLAIKLFRDDLGVVFKSLGKTLWHILFYMGHNLRPMVILMIPILLLFAQMQMRLAYDPLEVGDQVYIHVGVSEDIDLSVPGAMMENIEVRLRGTDEVVEGAIEFFNPVVPAAALSEVVFPVEVKKEGVFDLVFRIGDEEVTKSLHVGHQEGLPALSPARSNGLMDLILYPTEPHFGSDSSFEQIRLVHPSGATGYPTKPLLAFGVDLSFESELGMGLWFVVISILVAFALKGVFGVEF